MKKILLILILLVGCTHVSKLDEIETIISELDEVYVGMDENEMLSHLQLNHSEISNYKAFETLLVIDSKEIYVFENLDDQIIVRLSHLNYKVEQVNEFVIVMSERDEDLLLKIKEKLAS